MMNIEELASSQKAIGDGVQRLITNINKDSQSRKTQQYFQERLTLLQGMQAEFESIDTSIRSIQPPPLQHEYFVSGYYDKITALINRYIETFEDYLESFKTVPPSVSQISRDNKLETSALENMANAENQTPSEEQNHQAQGLIRKQKAMMKSIHRLLENISAMDNAQPVQAFQLKRKAMEQLWAQLQNGNYAICELIDDYECAEFLNLENIVHEQMLQLTLRTTTEQLPESSGDNKVQLPKITIPKFGGDYLQWRQFHDLFRQMVHTRQVPAIQKMWYLKNSLQGEAEHLIRHLPLTASNYDAAWQLLTDRYENKRVLTAASIQKLLSHSSLNNDSPTSAAIKSFHDNVKESLLSLNNLQIDTASWDPLLLHLLMKKLDKQTHMLFEQSLKTPKEIPTIDSFLKFLEFRFQSLEVVGQREKTKSANALILNKPLSKVSCRCCNKSTHPLYTCHKFLQWSPSDRLQFSQKQKLCVNCLKPNHKAITCNSRSCTLCPLKHNTLLHLKDTHTNLSEKVINATTTTALHQLPSSEQRQEVSLSASNKQSKCGTVILGTAKVRLTATNGKTIECRAVLDSGSQVNLITEHIVKKLGVNPNQGYLSIHGIGNVQRESHKRVNLKMLSRTTGFTANFEAFILPKIVSQQPSCQIDVSQWMIPTNCPLADPEFNIPSKIDLLLGAEFYFQLLSIGQISLSSTLPTLQNTLLGWVVSGKIDNERSAEQICGICTDDDEGTHQLMENFWKINESEFADTSMTAIEALCEAHFAHNTRRDVDGRFIVKLPFIEDPKILGTSEDIARRRFMSLERRLAKDPELKEKYAEFMDEYIKLRHMTEVKHESTVQPNYFIPHHCVLKPDSSSTKLRVVFDASSKSSTNLSLNDIMHVGPYIQSDLFTILLRFRLPRYVFTTDIQKMYRQIRVHPDDQCFQRIFWRRSPEEPLKTYQLNTVTYGTRAAPYLAIKCLRKLAQDLQAQYPLGAKVLLNNFYVDDGLAGSDNLMDAIHTQQQLIQLMNTAGMKLRKWSANNPRLLQDVPPEDHEVDLDFHSDCPEKIKTLGLTWLPKTDEFCITANSVLHSRITKRTVCADLAKIFDPLGLLAPIVVTAKMFVQELWMLKLDWDQSLPAELHTRWATFRESIASLHHAKFPRHIFGSSIAKTAQLHIFTDASERAYGAVAYVRSTLKNGQIIVRLLCARSKVAPLKKQTLPRLELCAAVMGAQMASRIQQDLIEEFTSTHFWTDSEIVLAWINSNSSSYHTFVANRISKIQENTSYHQWRHVKSTDNPADVVSRGIKPNLISKCNLWMYGPLFLHGTENCWPIPIKKELMTDTSLEQKQQPASLTCATTSTEHLIYNINHRNSFKALQHIVAYVLRFITHTKYKYHPRPNTTSLTTAELDKSLKQIVKTMQVSEFHVEMKLLAQQKEVTKTSSLSSLSPFLDNNGIIRVGGRLSESSLTYDAKHQLLLPYNDPLTKLLLQMIHVENYHCGPQALLAMTRQRFWPIKGKIMARSIVQHCVRCNKARPQLMTQMMGNLPASRVEPARPFITSGVDYCGPFWVHFKSRGKKPQKAYIAVFCCFKTKAVHLELVSELTTAAFIAALKRFVSRRGNCKDLYSDNATNFVGAKNELSELHTSIFNPDAQTTIITECSNKGIQFHFIPPRAPHFGGLWEAAVKSAKHLLVRSTSTASLTYEELETVVVEIEAVLNSRPITPMSNDPNDLEYLTPGHFLIGEPLTAPADPNTISYNPRLLTRWKLVSHIKQEIWKRWVLEYLNELQQRTKWNRKLPNIKEGDMVIIKEDNIPVMKWPLGRIVHTITGNDGLVRVAEIKTKSGVYKRPIHRLALLPIEPDEQPNPNSNVQEQQQAQEYVPGKRTSQNAPEYVPAKKITRPGPVATVLMCLLVLPTILTTPLENKPFGSNIGLHFEGIGSTRISTSTWNLIIYYELSPLLTERKLFYDGIDHLRNICGQLQIRSNCVEVLARLEHLRNDLPCDKIFSTERRFKRGAINAIGNAAHYLFGVLDSEYAEDMTNTINLVKQNENHIVTLIKNQTSVIDSTLNIIKQDQRAVKDKFDKINDSINAIVKAVHDQNQSDLQSKLFQLFTSLALQLIMMGTNIYQIQSSIFDLVTDSHHGRINPLLLSPEQLNEEVAKIKTHLPTTLHLPVEQDDVLQLYRLIKTVNGGIAENHLIFSISLPLVDQGSYGLFRIIPVPTASNNTMIAITPCADILAINAHRDQYFQLSNTQLSTCINPQEDKYICPNEQPRHNLGSTECACEVNMLNNDFKPICNVEMVHRNISWIKINRKNQWIYAMKTPIKVVTLCGQETFQVVLNGSGLLKLQPDCTLRHKFITINSHQTFSTTLRNSFTVLGNISEVSSPVKMTPVLGKPDLGHYRTLIKNLTDLQQTITSQEIHNLPNTIEVSNIHHFSVGYSALTLSVCVIIYIAWKLKAVHRETLPNPMPRVLPRSDSTDFSVDVS